MADALTVADRILAAVARAQCVDTADLLGRSRLQHIVHGRQSAIYLLRTFTAKSYPEIGRLVGRDHSTCLFSFRKTLHDVLRFGPRREIVMAALRQLDEEHRERMEARP